MKILLSALFASVTIVSAAQAADIYTPPPAEEFAYDYEQPAAGGMWNGPYIGLIGGYTFGESEIDIPVDPTIEFDGGDFGVVGGFNMQPGAGPLVFGLEADVMWSGQSGEIENSWKEKHPVHYHTQTDTFDMLWTGSVRGRAGFLITPQLMAFATGGVAFGQFDYETKTTGRDKQGNSWVDYESDATFSGVGLTWGGGLEWKPSEQLSFSVEYRTTDLDVLSIGSGDNEVKVGLDDQAVLFGIKYHF